MKISIDGILGTAQKINNQKEQEDNNLEKKKSDVKVDSVTIGARINSRLDSIESEFRDVQSSLTRNQIIRDGIDQLRNDLSGDGRNQQKILQNVTYDGAKILNAFIGEPITEATLNTGQKKNTELINEDVNRLKKFQVELDNITASDLAGPDRVKNITSNIDKIFSRSDLRNIEDISNIRADAVMRLIK